MESLKTKSTEIDFGNKKTPLEGEMPPQRGGNVCIADKEETAAVSGRHDPAVAVGYTARGGFPAKKKADTMSAFK